MTETPVVLASPHVRRRRLVDLEQHPTALDGMFVPGAEIVGRVTDPRLGADLAVPLLASQRLADLPRPVVALVPFRGRPTEVDWQAAERFTMVPQRYVALMDDVRTRRGAVPRWLQRVVLEQLFGYLRADTGMYTSTATLEPAESAAFHSALGALVASIDDELIAAYTSGGVSVEMRLALLLGAQARAGHTAPHTTRDAGRGLVRVSYLYFGDPPIERYTVGVTAVQPEHHKSRAIDFFGTTLLYERIVWLPDAVQVDVDTTGETAVRAAPEPGRVARYRRVIGENRRVVRRVARDVRIRRRAHRRAAVARYRDAWLLMDRDTAAQDNAEHLYRHLRVHEPDVNAWFVLSTDSPDWDRLQREGFRLLAYGSAEHFVALLNCAHLVSSQVDSYVVKPFRKHLLGTPGWRFTFLQHGVIKDDLSRWLNGKPIDVFVTSTPDEHASIAGDGSPYVFTDLETVLTGLARHDRLLELAGTREATQLVIMPTWRRELVGEQDAGNQRGLLDGFWTSEYALGWRALLESDRLRKLCESAGWRLVFVPHPNLAGYLDTSPLPDHVVAYRFSDIDVQEVLASAAAVVTDYSSLASEAAYIGRPVVYYQFDRDAIFAGGHVYRRGAWSYTEQGFGPIADTADGTLDALERIARDGGPQPEYAARMRDTFPFRDGRCCERTAAAIRRINRA